MSVNLLPRDGEVAYLPEYFSTTEADALLSEMNNCLDWSQETAHLFGRRVPLPRLTAWYGPTSYAYSGVIHSARPFPPVMQQIAKSIEQVAGNFDCALANLYRNGRDSVSWHSDNERLWGVRPTIVSVSFGATRSFRLRHKSSGVNVGVELDHGSVLIMSGETQQCWLHSIPKTDRSVGSRVNLTFRRLVTLSA